MPGPHEQEIADFCQRHTSGIDELLAKTLGIALGFNCLNLRRHGEEALKRELAMLIPGAMLSYKNGGSGVAFGERFLVQAMIVYDGQRGGWQFQIAMPLLSGEVHAE